MERGREEEKRERKRKKKKGRKKRKSRQSLSHLWTKTEFGICIPWCTPLSSLPDSLLNLSREYFQIWHWEMIAYIPPSVIIFRQIDSDSVRTRLRSSHCGIDWGYLAASNSAQNITDETFSVNTRSSVPTKEFILSFCQFQRVTQIKLLAWVCWSDFLKA